MKIKSIRSYLVNLPLITPFKTSYGELHEKKCDIIIVTDELGNEGYGELVAFETPDYVSETLDTERLIISKDIIPLLINKKIKHPEVVTELLKPVKGHWMGKSAVETAIWDLYAKRQHVSLSELFHSQSKHLVVGVSVGIQEDLDLLLEQVGNYVEAGYDRVKLKIKPGYDYEPLRVIREAYPNIMLMADANSAYTLKDINQLKKLDTLNLMMVEQPFSTDDFLDHAILAKEIETPICLDENIRSIEDCKLVVALGSAHAINLKIPRVGGITEAQKIVAYCLDQGLLVWLGGMLESGVGRALNLQFASQAGFGFPGDISATSRYFHQDVINEEFILHNGCLPVPQGIGIGVTLNKEVLGI